MKQSYSAWQAVRMPGYVKSRCPVMIRSSSSRTPFCPAGRVVRLTLWLARLGNRSLGALLFAHAGFIRGAMNFNRIDRQHALFAPAVHALQLADRAPRSLWARRSHFGFGAQCVLVTEVFSPRLLQSPPPRQLSGPGSDHGER